MDEESVGGKCAFHPPLPPKRLHTYLDVCVHRHALRLGRGLDLFDLKGEGGRGGREGMEGAGVL